MKKLLLLAGLALMVCSASAKKPAQKTQEEGYKFTDLTTVPTTSVKDQHRSGTCWCYSALSFLENEILRAGGPEMDLSEMWIVRNMYFDKGVKYVRLHGHLNFAEGGAAHDVIEGIKKYGIVPQEVYPGLNYGTEKPVFGELDAALKAYLDAVIKARNNGVLTTAWQDGLNALLDTYFGVRLKIHLRRQGIYPRIVRSVAADQDGRLCRRRFLHAPSVLHGVHHRSPRQLDVGHGLQRTAGGDDGRGR